MAKSIAIEQGENVMIIRDYIGEGTEYDKKEALEVKRPKSWLKSVSAFANGQGGVLLFGITDDDELVGLKDAEKDAENISEIIKNRMDPVPDIGLSIRRDVVDGSYRKFIVLRIYHGMETPYYHVGDGMHIAYIRVGNESVPAQATDLRRLILAGMHQTWDSLQSPYAASKFAFGRLHSAYLRRTGRHLFDTDFDSFGLIGADGMLTNAGALFADDSPVRHSRVFCTRWQGLDKASRIMDATNDRESCGSIVALFLDVMDFIMLHNQKRWKKLSREHIELPDYPEQAVEESLINALVHRDYLELGSEVHVDIFDNRMEIYSPGGMVAHQIVQNLDLEDVPSKRRNPVVAYVFGRMHYMERRGSGFKKIRDEYRNARHELAPSFYSDSVTFRLTLYKLNYGVSVDAQSEMLESSEDVGFTSKTRENQTRVKYNEFNRGHDGVNNVEISDVVNQTDVGINDADVGINGVDVVGKRRIFCPKTDEGGLKNVTSKTADTINKLMQNNPNTTVSDIVKHFCIARPAVTKHIKGRMRSANEKT